LHAAKQHSEWGEPDRLHSPFGLTSIPRQLLGGPLQLVLGRFQNYDPRLHLCGVEVELGADLDQLFITYQSNIYRPLLAGRVHFEQDWVS